MMPVLVRRNDLLSSLMDDANPRARFVGSMATTPDRGFAFPGTLDVSLQVVLRGPVHVSTAGERRTLTRGEAALLPGDVPLQISGQANAQMLEPPDQLGAVVHAHIAPKDAATFQVLTVGCEFQDPRSQPLLGGLPSAMYLVLPDALLQTAEAIARHTRNDALGAEFSTLRQAEAFLSEVVGLAISTLDAPASLVPALRDERITPALQAIHTDPADDWNIDRLAGLASLSRAAFSRRFTELIGVSPGDYVKRRRIQRARVLLRQSAMSVAEIATAVGYESESSFSRAYLSVTGERPGTARRTGARPRVAPLAK